ncbi:MAG: hypothetical protein ACI9VS_000883 [Candidatus Binatia bacterium]|jgi:hypothetical protein
MRRFQIFTQTDHAGIISEVENRTRWNAIPTGLTRIRHASFQYRMNFPAAKVATPANPASTPSSWTTCAQPPPKLIN